MYENLKIAYFSAEIGIDEKIKTYSGGLGILSGGTLRAMADLKVPLCAVTLLYKNGYFKQKIKDHRQVELEDEWDYKSILEDTNVTTSVNILGENVKIKIWKYVHIGHTGGEVPIFFLDTNLDENSDFAKTLTSHLYVGDRLAQEIVLGIGGIRALFALGINPEKYHMNEGHSAFLTLELYKKMGLENGWDDGQVKEKCVFTTHTPIPAGHDKFSYEEVFDKLKGEENIIPLHIKKLAGENELNTTRLALSLSCFHNGVSKKHGEVSRAMFPEFDIDYITNGVHVTTWASKPIADLFDKYISNWRDNAKNLKEVFKIPNSELFKAHNDAKSDLIDYVNENNIVDSNFKKEILTIGFARRFIQYKDAELIFQNVENLKSLGNKVQFIFAGKAHRNDSMGKDIMQRIIDKSEELKEFVSIAFLENYSISIAKKLVSGSDLWLNTPIPFNEASGTSGMKAAINGCMHFSRLDGWAIESFEMNGGGFVISDYISLYNNLKYKIIPMYYSNNKTVWVENMKLSIGNSAAYFNTHRMAEEYIKKAYKIN